MATLALGVLCSGSGTNLQAILDAVASGRLDADVRLVISNKPEARALERARKAGVGTLALPHRDFATREAFDAALVAALREAGAAWVVLAGFMRVLTPVFLGAFKQRIVNIHPALLPAFPGVHAQAQALAYGVKVSGCTVHFVDEGVDTGPVILQRAVPVLDDDTLDSLTQRILVEEHRAMVEALDAIAKGRVEIVPPGDAAGRARVRLRPT
jgi:phosphoribosylglycinamide formyltransferase-1